VRIALQEYRQNMVYLMGQVAVPGPYRLTHGNTLMEMVSKAGGFTPIAKRKKVKVIRAAGGKSEVFYVDATRITDQGKLEEDPVLMPGDMVVVPERFF
jgi:polysaccharide biosynthesis/export protein